jgi:hypothetical protein
MLGSYPHFAPRRAVARARGTAGVVADTLPTSYFKIMSTSTGLAELTTWCVQTTSTRKAAQLDASLPAVHVAMHASTAMPANL